MNKSTWFILFRQLDVYQNEGKKKKQREGGRSKFHTSGRRVNWRGVLLCPTSYPICIQRISFFSCLISFFYARVPSWYTSRCNSQKSEPIGRAFSLFCSGFSIKMSVSENKRKPSRRISPNPNWDPLDVLSSQFRSNLVHKWTYYY